MVDIFSLDRLNEYLKRNEWSDYIGVITDLIETNEKTLIYHNGLFDNQSKIHKIYIFTEYNFYILDESLLESKLSVHCLDSLSNILLELDDKMKLKLSYRMNEDEFILSSTLDSAFGESVKYKKIIQEIYKLITSR